ncbi:hypothetical protein BHE74_00001328 [Ensete ventricosum]|nr:hypothetical protein BHE74_00001328 [Ensete ventricosum]
MRIYSSLWDADDWATRGGLVKTDWSKAPFTAAFRSFDADGCLWSSGASSCSSSSSSWMWQELDATSLKQMRWVQHNYMIYDYCTDAKRFPQGLPLDSCESGAEICFIFREEPGQAKVTDLRLEFVIKEDVAGLDISMNNPQV